MRKAMSVKSGLRCRTLRLEASIHPQVGAGQLLIAVKAVSLNRVDLAQRVGTYGPAATSARAIVAGLDAAGEVLATGKDVRRVNVGDRVMALMGGGLAEKVVIDADSVVPIPSSWSYVEGAAAILGLLTEHNALRTCADMQPGETVLIHGATAAVGTLGAKLARYLGAGAIVATTRSSRAVDVLHSLGIDHVVHGNGGCFADEVLAITDCRGVDVIVDHVGGPYLEDNVRSLAAGGRLVSVGRLGGAETVLDLDAALAFKRLEAKGLALSTRTERQEAAMVHELRAEIDLETAAHDLRPSVDCVLPWSQAASARTIMESNANLGKIVLDVSDAIA